MIPLAAFLPTFVVLVAFCLPIGWLVAELRKQAVWQRLLLGVASIVMVAWVYSEYSDVFSNYTRLFMMQSIRDTAYLLEKGKSEEVATVYRAHTQEYGTAVATYEAASDLRDELGTLSQQTRKAGAPNRVLESDR